ncbi:MAG: hypothetical protein D6725_17645 [Planctomycetota bacterium]|nr:MAG: hypothetical protein D6725_17645 [Planctomycetota bacterium]
MRTGCARAEGERANVPPILPRGTAVDKTAASMEDSAAPAWRPTFPSTGSSENGICPRGGRQAAPGGCAGAERRIAEARGSALELPDSRFTSRSP